MKMEIMFNWSVYNDSRTLEAVKKGAKRVNKAKRELVYYSLHLTL